MIRVHDLVFKSRVLKLLREGDIENRRYEVTGVISRFKDDLPSPHFVVKDWSGKFVKIDMPEEKRHQILEFISEMIPIKLTGIGTKKRFLEITDLDELEIYNEILLDSIHDTKLRAPIKAKVSYERVNDSDYAIIGNDELGVYGVDSTVNKAKEMFDEDLYSKYIAYKSMRDDKLTVKALELKIKLIDLFKE